jgi:hypothetical protein
MNELINYQTFSNLEEASHLIDLLNANNIPFAIDDSAMRFDISAQHINPLQGGVIVKIQAADVEKADEIYSQETESVDDHYLYSFSDNDIIDVIVNPQDWTEEEIALAKQISAQRNLQPTAELVKSLRKNTDAVQEQIKQENTVRNGASWFLWIAILSALNTTLIIFNQNLHFPVGLGINELIMGTFWGYGEIASMDLRLWGYVASFVLPAFFVFIWAKSKKQNEKMYLAGMIIYGIDTLCALLLSLWVGTAFHVLVLWALYAGYKTMKKREQVSNKM